MKPILFNTEMVRAILDGRKTVTRRVAKGKILNSFVDVGFSDEAIKDIDNHLIDECQYKVGDVLYVRETWQNVFETEYDRNAEGYCVNIRTRISNFDNIPKSDLGLSTEDSCALMKPRSKYCVYLASDISYSDEKYKLKWRPSLHMPKSAARIFIKVTDVRVERLQEITPEQAVKEGISKFDAVQCVLDFGYLWDSTIKKSNLDQFGWEANPWVWVIEFERCEKPQVVL